MPNDFRHLDFKAPFIAALLLFLLFFQCYSQVCKSILQILESKVLNLDEEMKGILQKLIDILQRHLVSLQWEVRDTTLELILNLVKLDLGKLWWGTTKPVLITKKLSLYIFGK